MRVFHNVVIPRKRGITALLSSVIPPQGGILLNFDVNTKIPHEITRKKHCVFFTGPDTAG